MKLENLIKNYFEITGKETLDLSFIFGQNLPCMNDENGWRAVEEIYIFDGTLFGFTYDKDYNASEELVVFSKEDEEKIINWLTNNT